ncbi:MAG: tetratricopeptide repeat protein [Verrucomicrobiales bacterium]|nr:tetratricopeptide repeat protein [Verrucomicrobiales bacterium]
MRIRMSSCSPAMLALALATGLCAPAVVGAARDSASNRLRKLVELPKVTFELSLKVDLWHGWVFAGDELMAPRRIKELRAALDGSADDAEHEVQIALLYKLLEDDTNEELMLKMAQTAFERQGARESRDDKLVAAFAECLMLRGGLEEAEPLLRKVVGEVAEAWRCRLALARLLLRLNGRTIAPAVGGTPPSQADLSLARERAAESLVLADEALKRAPDEAEAFLGRAYIMLCERLGKAMLTEARGEELALATAAAIFSPDAIPDLTEAVRHSPESPRVAAIRVWHELLGHTLGSGRAGLEGFPGNLGYAQLPEGLRATVRETLASMDSLSRSGDPGKAAEALALTGALELFVMQNSRRAEEVFRRAVVLDSGLEPAWEQCSVALVQDGRFDALVEVCRDRLKAADTARSRVMLGKALDRAGRPEEALAELSQARERYPKDTLANLALCAALLRNPEVTNMNAVATLLQSARNEFGKQPSKPILRSFLFQQGVLLALINRLDQARASFQQVLRIEPGDDGATEALRVLDEMAVADQAGE